MSRKSASRFLIAVCKWEAEGRGAQSVRNDFKRKDRKPAIPSVHRQSVALKQQRDTQEANTILRQHPRGVVLQATIRFCDEQAQWIVRLGRRRFHSANKVDQLLSCSANFLANFPQRTVALALLHTLKSKSLCAILAVLAGSYLEAERRPCARKTKHQSQLFHIIFV